MYLKDIKKIVKILGQVVLLEEDGFGLVILPLERYLGLVENRGQAEEIRVNRASLGPGNGREEVLVKENEEQAVTDVSNEQDLVLIEKLNQDIAMLKEEIKKRELEELENDVED